MKLFACNCGNPLFFDNVLCLGCGGEAGWCPRCKATVTLVREGEGYRCGNEACGALLLKCANYAGRGVCTRCVEAQPSGQGHALCDACRFTEVIPDLSVEGNLQKWARLEAAKRRLLYTLDLLRLPYGTAADGFTPPLSFDFKADQLPGTGQWSAMGDEEQVFTGHADGKITINIKEADPVEREKQRMQLGERRRTVIRHFRHEIGHYYWDMLVKDRREPDFIRMFGDHENPSYQDALSRHYAEGPPADWPERFVSAYASMHPWEDFAETFALYLDMASVLDTAGFFHLLETVDMSDFPAMVDGFVHTGLVMNEMTREMGLVDYTPEVMVQPVRDKLTFVHELVSAARAPG